MSDLDEPYVAVLKQIREANRRFMDHTDPECPHGITVSALDKAIAVLEYQRDHIPENCVLTAHHSGDGWALFVESSEGDQIAMLKWPESWFEPMFAADLEELGFKIV